MERRPGRLFRIFITVFLVGIFLELGAILGVLTGKKHPRGNVAVIEVNGEIDDGRETLDLLRDHLENEAVKAIVLRVNSPGGAVGTSQEIHDMVQKVAQKKKIVVSMGDVAASGGYYISAPAHKIIANPGTLTGSLGVIANFFIIGDLLKKAYLHWEIIKSGEYKDVGSPLRPLTLKERDLLQKMTDDIHLQFIEAVAAGRKMKLDEVRKIADGRVFSGRQAKELGLVDELGGLDQAIETAAKLAGVQGKPEVIYPEREKFGWFRRLAEGKIETPSLKIEYRLAP